MRGMVVALVVAVVVWAWPGDAAAQGERGVISGDNAVALEAVTRLESTLQEVYTVAFSPDGALIAAGGYAECDPAAERITCPGRVAVWTTADGALAVELDDPGGPVISLSFSPDNIRLAALGTDGQIHVWNMPGGQMVTTLINEQGAGDVTFNLDATLLASTGDRGLVRLWNLSSGEESTPLEAGYSTKISLAFSPIEPVLALGTYQQVALWNVVGMSENGGVVNVPSANLRSGPGTGYAVLGVAYSGDTVIILGTNDAGDWYNVETADGQAAWIAAFLVDTGFEAGRMPREVATLALPAQGTAMATDLAFSADGTRLAAAFTVVDGTGGGLGVWRLVPPPTPEGVTPTPSPTPAADSGQTGPELIGSLLSPDEITGLDFNLDASLVAFASRPAGDVDGGSLHLWDAVDETERARFGGPFSDVDFSPDGTWLAAGRRDGVVDLWAASGP